MFESGTKSRKPNQKLVINKLLLSINALHKLYLLRKTKVVKVIFSKLFRFDLKMSICLIAAASYHPAR